MLEDLAAVDPTIAGATFVPLVDVTSSELVLPAIAAHRGIDEGQSDSLIDASRGLSGASRLIGLTFRLDPAQLMTSAAATGASDREPAPC